MLLVGYFEGTGSQRGIAWRCSDSLSLREFLGVPLGKDSSDHSSLSYIRNRLPYSVHEAVFVWVLALAHEKKLLKGKTVGIDSTTLEADAAMMSIVRKDTGEDWKGYLTRLMHEEGCSRTTMTRPVTRICESSINPALIRRSPTKNGPARPIRTAGLPG
jgi:transposase